MTQPRQDTLERRSAVHTSALDAVRAISALVVFVSHIVQIFWLPLVGINSIVHLINNLVSETAVIVFFILSGYLISLSIHRNAESNGGFVVLSYLRSRFLRIYPPLVGAVLVSLAVWGFVTVFDLPGSSAPLKAVSDSYSARETISLTMPEVYHALTMRSGMLTVNGPLWSLYIEIRLYVAAGIAAVAFTYCPARIWKVAAAVAGFVLASFVVGRTQPEYLLYAAWWLVGALFFFSRHLSKHLGSRTIGLVAALGLAGGIVVTSKAPHLLELARIAIILTLSYFMFARWRSAPGIFVRISSVSYTLYLFHFPLLIAAYSLFVFACGGNAPSVAARMVLTLVSAVLVLAISAKAGDLLENTKRFDGLLRLRVGRAERVSP